jgi:signal transduction histidine kinase
VQQPVTRIRDARAPVLAAVAVVGVVLGLAAESASFHDLGLDRAAADVAVGWAFIGSGILAGTRRRDATAALMVLTGGLWFAGSFWDPLLYLHRGALVTLAAGLAHARLRRPAACAVAALGWLAAAHPLATSTPLTAALAAALLAVAARRRAAREPWPLVATPALAAAAIGLATASASVTAYSGAGDALLLAYEGVLVAITVTSLRALPSGRASGAAVADLVVDLGRVARTSSLRGALARALGDPSLVVAYRVGSDKRYVDEEGRPVELPAEGSGRVVTHVEGDGRRMAALVYDPGVIDDPPLVAAIAAAARLALVNARLRAQVALQLDDLQASRRRLVDAADEQRARLEQRLHDGAERRLDAFAATLDSARDDARAGGDDAGAAQLDAAAQELERARADVRALARGLHPRTLGERGLLAALTQLADSSPLDVTVQVPAERFPAAVEAAAYFVCAEALANVGKYASATRVTCSATTTGGVLRVTVQDDGVGGADVAAGSGLRGLADRLDALGGELAVGSPPGGGTRVTARIPVNPRHAPSGEP